MVSINSDIWHVFEVKSNLKLESDIIKIPYSGLFTWGAFFADVFNLTRDGYFH